MTPATSLSVGTLQTCRPAINENGMALLGDSYSPFLRKLHGAFFALFAKTARCSGVNSYLCEYLHVDYIVAISAPAMSQKIDIPTPLKQDMR